MSRRKQSHPKSIKKKSEDELIEIARLHELPHDFRLRHPELQSRPTTEYGVFASRTISEGTTFGPYTSKVIRDESDGIDCGEYTIELQSDATQPGDRELLCLVDERSRWIRLVLTTSDASLSNAVIKIIGTDETVCFITKEIAIDAELVAMLDRDVSVSMATEVKVFDKVTRNDVTALSGMVKPSPTSPLSKDATTPDLSRPNSPEPGYPLNHACVHCGVRYSSESTLKAHLAFYCAKKPEDPVVSMETTKKRKLEEEEGDEVEKKVKKEKEEDEEEEKCPHCTFTCTSTEALNQHLRLHFPEDNLKPPELFCKECDIQFTSLTTYRGHKLYYCQQRRRVSTPGRRDSTSPRRTPSAKTRAASPGAAALPFPPTNGHLTPPVAHPALHMLHTPFPMPYIHIVPDKLPSPKTPPPPPPPASSEDQPLDLSTKPTVVKQEPKSPPRRPRTPATASPVRPEIFPMGLLPLVQPQHAAMLLLQQQQQQQQQQQRLSSVSKCEDCNIVFYKLENYIAHKEHYCASRRHTAQIPNGGDSTPHSRSPSSPRIEPHTPKSPRTPTTDDPLLCGACRIPFSSPETLRAHQAFYCPARRSPDSADSTLACPHCGATFGSARLMGLHYCTGSAAHLPLFHCPHCEYIAQSDTRLAEHLKAHSPSKAYKCALCGYRGNTVRGMRMHGKMHADNGTPFADEHVMEFEEPPLIPKQQVHLRHDDLESELIRMKSEPYKRRKSRKGYEKSEYRQRPLRSPTPEVKNEDIKDAKLDEDRKENVDITQISQIKQESSPPPCKTEPPSPTPSPDIRDTSSSSPNTKSPTHSHSVANILQRKSPEKTTAKHCKQCDISFTYLSTFLAHKKYYCTTSTEVSDRPLGVNQA